MGNDGGSIPKRREVVKQKRKAEKIETADRAKTKATNCVLSQEPLREPIVVCKLGHLYNKENVIKNLIEKTMPHAFRHIKKLKDVKGPNVVMKDNADQNTKTIVCPITQNEYNGFNRFVIVWICGCILSEEAINEIKMTDKCLVCGMKATKGDLVCLDQSPEEQEAYLHVLDKQDQIQQDKKNKKKDKHSNKNEKSSKKRHDREDQGEIEEEEKVEHKRQKVDNEDEEKEEETEKMKKSEAYKSLFARVYKEDLGSDYLSRCVHRGLR